MGRRLANRKAINVQTEERKGSHMATSASFPIWQYLLLVFAVFILFGGCSPPDPSTELKPLIDAYINAWNTGDFTSLHNVVSPDFELRMSPRFNPIKGIDSLKLTIAAWRTPYPDFTITVNELVYSKEKVALRWTIHATNTGPGAHPPTGKAVVFAGMSIFHISGGKIVDEWITNSQD
jgi:steroid delta-isomerase-like uncharacterized protein